jgi:hypothetical protein
MKIKLLFHIMVLCILSITIGCKPCKVLDPVEIKPNETCWVIPLDSQTESSQAKFNSVDFLNQKKVAAKRIMVDKVERSVGRMYWDIEWIPAVRVIKVDRSLVTREWVDGDAIGTSKKDEGIHVNTKDNIKLDIGITITVSIDEDNASTYLYYHGERPLSEITDSNVRSFITKVLSQHVSSMDLVEFQNRQVEIYNLISKEVTDEFKSKGITVQYVGNANGWRFVNEKIQESINASYIAQQDNKTAEMEQAAQKTRNATAILNQENNNKIKVISAQAEVDSAQKLQSAKEAAAFQNQLQIALVLAKAQATMAEKWDGRLPSNILPANSQMLMNLGLKESPNINK